MDEKNLRIETAPEHPGRLTVTEKTERPTKQVIVMRKDLGMLKGKMIAQGAHASLKALLDTGVIGEMSGYDGGDIPAPARLWLEGSFTKICVSVTSEEELLAVFEDAGKRLSGDCPMALITDSGRTEFNGVPTNTCCAIGPWWSDEVDEITGKLPLF